MALSTGTRFGPYEVVAPIGAGGMGEVYRARDTKLNRDVAIKILPDALAADPDRMARFAREARVLASLNHPNIATIYGMEDRALILELFAGPTVSDTLAAVLTKQPDFDIVPPRLRRLLRMCLAKDPRQRMRDIGDARFLMDEAADAPIAPAPPRASRRALAWALVGAVL